MQNARLEQLFQFYSENSQDCFVLYAIATEYVSLAQYSEALRYFGELLSVNVGYLGAYYHIAKVHEKMDNAPLAVFFYKKGILIATQQKDLKTLSELQAALALITPDDDED